MTSCRRFPFYCALLLLPSLLFVSSQEPANNTDPFWICEQLNIYGCNPHVLPAMVLLAFDNVNMDVPANPCLFRTINMSDAWALYPPSTVTFIKSSLITVDILIANPCELNVQMQDVLLLKNVMYLIDYAYWFSTPITDNTGACDVEDAINIAENGLVCDNSSNFTFVAPKTDKCFANDQCPHPFELSNYHQEYFADLGMCRCGIPCEVYPYPGNIAVLDTFTHIANWITVAFIIGYFYNLYLELKQMRKNGDKFANMPLTFDIPFVCACSLVVFAITLMMPQFVGKSVFGCEQGTKAMVRAKHLPHANWACFIQGSLEFISLTAIYNYFALLSFCVWRYLSAPMRPLFGIRKRYFHLALWTYVLGLYAALAIRNKIGAVVTVGLCGATLFEEPDKFIFSWYPLMAVMVVFLITTPLSVWKIYVQITRNSKFMSSASKKRVSKELTHLSMRLIVYSFFLFCSLVCFMYINGEIIYNAEKWNVVFGNYLQCLYYKHDLPELFETEYPGETRCEMDPGNHLPMVPYFMQGTIELLIAVASFSLSCSNQRTRQWAKSSERVLSRVSSVIGSTVKSEDENEVPMPGDRIDSMGSMSHSQRSIGSGSANSRSNRNGNKRTKRQKKQKQKRNSNNNSNNGRWSLFGGGSNGAKVKSRKSATLTGAGYHDTTAPTIDDLLRVRSLSSDEEMLAQEIAMGDNNARTTNADRNTGANASAKMYGESAFISAATVTTLRMSDLGQISPLPSPRQSPRLADIAFDASGVDFVDVAAMPEIELQVNQNASKSSNTDTTNSNLVTAPDFNYADSVETVETAQSVDGDAHVIENDENDENADGDDDSVDTETVL